MVKSSGNPGGAGKDEDSKKMQVDTQAVPSDRGGAQVDSRIQTEIGKHLRAIYDDVINEPIPSKFMELLEKLERSTSEKG
jgi:hypothetical protein